MVQEAVPDTDEVRAALGRLQAFADFQSSPRLASFIAYIVEETLAGRADALRAYTVARSVFERGEDFDPHSNSIVRVEATRLRKALKTYYESDGARDPVRIEVPLGGYAPRFIRTEQTASLPVPSSEDAPTALAFSTLLASAAQTRKPVIRFALLGAGIATLAVVSAIATHTYDRPAPPVTFASAKPVADSTINDLPPRSMPQLSVSPVQVIPENIDAYAMAGTLQRDLANALSRFDEINVVRGFVRSTQPPQRPADYELQSQIEIRDHGLIEASFRLLHNLDRHTLWSGVFTLPSLVMDTQARSDLVRSVVMPLAQPFGAIDADLRAQFETRAETPKSVECIARFEDYWETRVEAKRKAAFDCVNAALTDYPKTSVFLVELSNLYVAEYLGNLPKLGPDLSLDAAQEAAECAIRLSPGRAHPYLALAQVLNLRGDFERALSLAEHAQEINPYDSDITAQLGALYILRGKTAEGTRLLSQAMNDNPAYPGWMKFYLFVEAYLRGDHQGQQSALSGVEQSGEPAVAFARVIAAVESGRIDDAKTELTSLRSRFPHFAAAPKAALERLTVAPELVERLLASAQKAGL